MGDEGRQVDQGAGCRLKPAVPDCRTVEACPPGSPGKPAAVRFPPLGPPPVLL